MRKLVLLPAMVVALLSSPTFSQSEESRTLKVYNWEDYIGEGVIEQFEEETGIEVTYDTYDSNLEVEEKIIKGGGGYDVVIPTIDFMSKQVKRGLFKRIDRSKLTNYGNLDNAFMASISELDIENAHGVPYMWGTTGMGYNVSEIERILGKDAPTDSWDLIFDLENLKKLSSCGVSILDEPTEIVSIALNYLKKNPNSTVTSDYTQVVEKFLTEISQYVIFDSANFLDNLAAGKICVAVAWSGDIFQAQANAEEAGNGVEISYVIPEEGTVRWVDMLAIPELSQNVDEAHQFIDFLMRPDIAAKNTNYIWYANPIPDSVPLIDDEIKSDASIYPTQKIQDKLFYSTTRSIRVRRTVEQLWGAVLNENKRYRPAENDQVGQADVN